MKDKLKVGLIGFSSGNGHPYSWSAIINGFDKKEMKKTGYPIILTYLENNSERIGIKDVSVTHVWTQEYNESRKIAKASLIENIVSNPLDMLDKVDAILLARDDAENHLSLSKPFIRHGLPIYIDKPLAYSIKEANKLFHLQKYPGQIFSCSAFIFAKELHEYIDSQNSSTGIKAVYAYAPKDWKKYSIHLIDPLLKILPQDAYPVKSQSWNNGISSHLIVEFMGGITACLNTSGLKENKFKIIIQENNRFFDITFNDTFYAFKQALTNFFSGIQNQKILTTQANILKAIKLVEMGDTL